MNGERQTANLTLAPDPRVRLPQSAYDEQFALVMQIEQTRVALGGAREAARRPAYFERGKTISGATSPETYSQPPAEPTTLRFIADALASLHNAVDSADAAPTADMRAGWRS